MMVPGKWQFCGEFVRSYCEAAHSQLHYVTSIGLPPGFVLLTKVVRLNRLFRLSETLRGGITTIPVR